VSIFIGSHILAFFGISLPVVQVGGGLLVAAAGWRLLDPREDQLTTADATPWAPDEIIRRAFYPLTLLTSHSGAGVDIRCHYARR